MPGSDRRSREGRHRDEKSRRQARRRHIAKRLLLWLAPSVLILAGLAIVAFAVISRLSVAPEQQRLVAEYRSAQYGAEASSAPQASALTELPNPDAAAQDDDTGPKTLAVLSIPSIGLEVAVREGVGSSSLKYSVGHYALSALPGETGNCVIMGHRNYTFGEFFNRLDELAAGDTVSLERAGTVYTYTVTETFVTLPDDTGVLQPSDEAALTLITCTPVRVATHRLIVRCALSGAE
jgi:LPXTG-site transpeptidase (sortase) family protein